MVRKGLHINHTKNDSGGSRKSVRLLLLLLVSGVMTGFTIIYSQIGIFEWLTLIPMAYVLLDIIKKQNVSLKRAYVFGLFFFMSFYIVIYHWFLYLYPLEFTGMDRGAAAVVVIAGWFGLSILQATVGALIFPLMLLFGRTKLIKANRFFTPLLAASLWVVFEWSQTLFWTGVPWARLAIGQTDMPIMIETASLFGPYLITFFIVAVNFFIAFALHDKSKIKLCATVTASLLIFNITAGAVLLASYSDKNEEKFTAAVIQANIGSGDKWDMQVSDMLDVYIKYTRLAVSHTPDIIIWPETSIPVTLEKSPNTVSRIKALSSECEVPIIVGIFTEDGEGNGYNSLVLIKPDGSIGDETYSKRHLVPFGEYLPMRDIIATLIPPLTEIAMLEEDLTPGEDSGIIENDGIKYGSLICFDSIYEQLTRTSVLDGAEVLVISTNDSWFFDSAAGRMHNAQAKLRAVESGRYVLRAANTGISSIITPTGKVIDYIKPLVPGISVAEVGARENKTLYMLTGNILVAACGLLCLVPAAYTLALLMLRRKESDK